MPKKKLPWEKRAEEREEQKKQEELAVQARLRIQSEALARSANWGGKRKWPRLARTRYSPELQYGKAIDWKGNYGWIKPDVPVEHDLASAHEGRLYVSVSDIVNGPEDEASPDAKQKLKLVAGRVYQFYIYYDDEGIGAEEVVDEQCIKYILEQEAREEEERKNKKEEIRKEAERQFKEWEEQQAKEWEAEQARRFERMQAHVKSTQLQAQTMFGHPMLQGFVEAQAGAAPRPAMDAPPLGTASQASAPSLSEGLVQIMQQLQVQQTETLRLQQLHAMGVQQPQSADSSVPDDRILKLFQMAMQAQPKQPLDTTASTSAVAASDSAGGTAT